MLFICCAYILIFFVFFFFQAEDGIRDGRVTGVQTCALPISGAGGRGSEGSGGRGREGCCARGESSKRRVPLTPAGRGSHAEIAATALRLSSDGKHEPAASTERSLSAEGRGSG